MVWILNFIEQNMVFHWKEGHLIKELQIMFGCWYLVHSHFWYICSNKYSFYLTFVHLLIFLKFLLLSLILLLGDECCAIFMVSIHGSFFSFHDCLCLEPRISECTNQHLWFGIIEGIMKFYEAPTFQTLKKCMFMHVSDTNTNTCDCLFFSFLLCRVFTFHGLC